MRGLILPAARSEDVALRRNNVDTTRSRWKLKAEEGLYWFSGDELLDRQLLTGRPRSVACSHALSPGKHIAHFNAVNVPHRISPGFPMPHTRRIVSETRDILVRRQQLGAGFFIHS
jgi:hypothetical protein